MRGLVRVDAGVLDDDAAGRALGRPRLASVWCKSRGELAALEEQVDVAAARDLGAHHVARRAPAAGEPAARRSRGACGAASWPGRTGAVSARSPSSTRGGYWNETAGVDVEGRRARPRAPRLEPGLEGAGSLGSARERGLLTGTLSAGGQRPGAGRCECSKWAFSTRRCAHDPAWSLLGWYHERILPGCCSRCRPRAGRHGTASCGTSSPPAKARRPGHRRAVLAHRREHPRQRGSGAAPEAGCRADACSRIPAAKRWRPFTTTRAARATTSTCRPPFASR